MSLKVSQALCYFLLYHFKCPNGLTFIFNNVPGNFSLTLTVYLIRFGVHFLELAKM